MLVITDSNVKNNIKSFKVSFNYFYVVLMMIAFWVVYSNYTSSQIENKQTHQIIFNPQVNDIYFIDSRTEGENRRPNDKYRIAKVVDITGDIITLLHGGYFYPNHNAVVNSIKYGQVSFGKYFQGKRHNLPKNEVIKMYETNVIYLAKRPYRGKLYGQSINPVKKYRSTNPFIYGHKENMKGEELLNDQYSESALKKAFELFQKSSELGYFLGQVNLAEMYINGLHVEKDLTMALFLLKQASLQSYKPAILKYGIVCQQVPQCIVNDFYRELSHSGVNIKVRELDFKLK